MTRSTRARFTLFDHLTLLRRQLVRDKIGRYNISTIVMGSGDNSDGRKQ